MSESSSIFSYITEFFGLGRESSSNQHLSFASRFNSEYLIHPNFVDSSYNEFLRIASQNSKPLFFYLHSSMHDSTPSFCANTLCCESIVDFLSANFICWGGDVLNSEAFKVSSILGATSFPYVCVCSLERPNKVNVIFRNCGEISESKLLESLVSSFDTYQATHNLHISQEETLNESRTIRSLQDAEYEAAVEEDLATQLRDIEEKVEQERLKTANEMAKNAELNEVKKRVVYRESKLNSLPVEPKSSDPGAILICVKLPDGQRRQRYFYESDQVGSLIDWVETHELLSSDGSSKVENFQIIQLLPRIIFSNREDTLQNAGVTNRTILYVEEVWQPDI